MGRSTERPGASLKSPELNGSKEVLKKLLAIELKRLETAVRIEGERNIIFPETTIIIRDIYKLHSALTGKEEGSIREPEMVENNGFEDIKEIEL